MPGVILEPSALASHLTGGSGFVSFGVTRWECHSLDNDNKKFIIITIRLFFLSAFVFSPRALATKRFERNV